MGYTLDQIKLLQGEIIDQSNQVFEAMKVLADDATAKALDADLTVDTSGLPPKPIIPDVNLYQQSYTEALKWLEFLRGLLDPTKPLPYPPAYSEPSYTSGLLTALNKMLLADLQNGGYGIEVADEENLWNRARERELRAMQSMQDSAIRQFAVAGFPMPTGSAQNALRQIQQETSEKIATANRDIAIKRADMYVENRKFAMTTSLDLEKLKIDAFNKKFERLLEAWKAEILKVLDEYKTRTSIYTAVAGAYVSLYSANSGLAQAQAQLAIGQINAAVAIYRAEMDKIFESAKLELEGKKSAAGIYMALATAAMSSMNVNTGMSAAAGVSQGVQTGYNYNYDENA